MVILVDGDGVIVVVFVMLLLLIIVVVCVMIVVVILVVLVVGRVVLLGEKWTIWVHFICFSWALQCT